MSVWKLALRDLLDFDAVVGHIRAATESMPPINLGPEDWLPEEADRYEGLQIDVVARKLSEVLHPAKPCRSACTHLVAVEQPYRDGFNQKQWTRFTINGVANVSARAWARGDLDQTIQTWRAVDEQVTEDEH